MAISSDSPFAKESATTILPTPNGNTHHDSKTNGAMNLDTTTASKSSLDASSAHHDVDNTAEFTGDISTNNELPSQEILKKVENMMVLDKDGKALPFKSLYSGPNVARRVLVIFIRHFFCGNCQEYLRTLTASISEDSLLSLNPPTFIAIVGCGSPSLITMYQEVTSCPFPIYADPTKKLYDELGMMRTLDLGPRPEYQRRSTVLGMLQSIGQGLKHIKGGQAFQGGGYQQVGGEFLFEPVNAATPISSPAFATPENNRIGENGGILGNGLGYEHGFEEKKVTWCHRMRNTRDHAEIPELREVLGFEDEGVPGKDKKRWSKALGERKGTGISSVSSNRLRGVSEEGTNGLSSQRHSQSSEKLMDSTNMSRP